MLLSQRKARSQLKGRRQVAKPVHLETLSGKEWEGFQPTAYILTTKVFDLPLLVSSNGQETPTTVGAVLREL